LSPIQVEAVTWTLCPEVSWDSSETKYSVLVTVPIRLNDLSHTENRLFIFIHLARFFMLEMKRVTFIYFSVGCSEIDGK